MKVFISHHSSDAAVASRISDRLRNVHLIDTYLDVIDPMIGRRGEELAEYLRRVMAGCTNLMAVVSPSTKSSQWVPWEIGVASEREMPLAAYTSDVYTVPEFLAAWPRLVSLIDVDSYAQAAKQADQTVIRKRGLNVSLSESLRAGRTEFYSSLRAKLRQ